MKKPNLPENEEARLRSLRSLNILDTPAEERFDRLTRLARRMFGVPIALVSLVDENRQWFKSCAGLDVSETPRDISFCGHAILGDEILMIPDTQMDDRFADNPLVLNQPNIRFYAGCPLRYLDGSKLGTFCLIDQNPKTLNEEELDDLKGLAALAERELVMAQLATLDDLTKISNRRGFIELAQHSLNICARQNIPASLVFFDLDKFKLINDELGHREGDKALILFADKMRSIFRDSDVFARLGGDEFVVLLTNTSLDHAENIIERLRSSLDEDNQHNKGYNLSFSAGIVTVEPGQDRSIAALLDRADSLMYEEKNQLVS
tara:strand:+ start:16172 stop:17131 length:960 start_codon:yes stop_codon:yes gene_type:complete